MIFVPRRDLILPSRDIRRARGFTDEDYARYAFKRQPFRCPPLYPSLEKLASNSSVQAWAGVSATDPAAKAYGVAPTAGNLLVCCAMAETTGNFSISDDMTDGGVWATAIGPTANATLADKLITFWKQVGVTANTNKTVTVALSTTGDTIVMAITEIHSTVAGGTWAKDGTAVGTSGNSANPSAGVITTADSNPYIVGFCANTSSAATAGSGFSSRFTDTSVEGVMVEDQFATASGNYTVAMTHTADQWAAQGVAFKSTAASGTGHGLFIPSLLNGLGSGGPFFNNQLG